MFSNSDTDGALKNGLIDSIRQLLYPREFRIDSTDVASVAQRSSEPTAATEVALSPESNPDVTEVLAKVLAEVATSLWHVKTKFFKLRWDQDEREVDNPKARRLLGRINRGIQALQDCGLELKDPTGERYPPGSEHSMYPVQMLPTPGIVEESVSDTVTPLIYLNDKMIQRAQVFVAVPRFRGEESSGPSDSAVVRPANTSLDDQSERVD